MKFDAIIIGGGIVGAACANRLSQEGLQIALVEKDFIASGATSAGMGHLVLMDDSEPQFALTRLSLELWTRLEKVLPAECEYENCGTIWVAEDSAELETAERKADFYAAAGCKARVINRKELYRLEPNLRRGLAGGLLVRNEGVVYQLCASKYFIDQAKARGTSVFEGEKAMKIEGDTLVLGSGTTLVSDYFINAAGTAAAELSPGLKITPRKGHLVITDRYPGFIFHQVLELGYSKSAHQDESESVAFNVQPRSTGQILVGSSRQPGEAGDRIDRKIVAKMMRRAFSYMPGLARLHALRVWQGKRPATPDNLPYIGRSPSNEKIIVAAGHEGLGITTSLGTAELVADELLGRESAIPRSPYSPTRLDVAI
ncbi:MAG: FAD-binding oxidoreductase [Acidobacteriota bacterium]|nr:FAD-binding oxidoreductase [Acidobacteriota bacterium]